MLPIDECDDDIELFNTRIDTTVRSTLETIADKPAFARLSYGEALEILEKAQQPFEFPPAWGHDLQSEHERFLTEEELKCPVIVYDYPAQIKPFYMRVNDDGRTVRAMDVLVPRVGEIIGGSQREERLDVVTQRLEAQGLHTPMTTGGTSTCGVTVACRTPVSDSASSDSFNSSPA